MRRRNSVKLEKIVVVRKFLWSRVVVVVKREVWAAKADVAAGFGTKVGAGGRRVVVLIMFVVVGEVVVRRVLRMGKRVNVEVIVVEFRKDGDRERGGKLVKFGGGRVVGAGGGSV